MLLQEARESWERLSAFRKNRNRCRDYTFGRQWNDLIEVNGRKITEYEYILSEGNVPLKNNLIRRIVRNVLGVFRDRLPKIMEAEYGGDLALVASQNSLEELFCRTFEEFLISGMAVHRKRLGYMNGKHGVWTEQVSPQSFFFSTESRDVRGWDLNLAGQIHSVDFRQWCRAFVKSPAEFKKAKELFDTEREARPFGRQTSRRVNVMEVWRKEIAPRYLVHDAESGRLLKVEPGKEGSHPASRKRWILEEVWRYYFLSEDGSVLAQGDSPYLHGGHPYVVKLYPFLDGEIQSFVGDMIDQQRYTNRLITMYDWVIRASAKGVLLLPEGAVAPENLQNVVDQWGRFNGVIVYNADPANPEPKQISGNVSNLGISELLEIQLKMLEDVSGVNGILQGNTSGGNVSGALYNSQTTNAMYSLSDILETFRAFIRESAQRDRELKTKD